MRTLILVPGFKGFFSVISKVARKAVAGTTAMVTSDIDRAIALYKGGRFDKVAVVMGAKRLGKEMDPLCAYEYLVANGVEAVLVDSFEWGVKEQLVLQPHYLPETVLGLCV